MTNIKAIHLGLSQLNKIILGKEREIKLSLSCLLARGHLLIEDLPGMGKTTLAHALASTLGLSYQRIQFTNDLLPGDLLGLNIFSRDDGKFHFHPGPIFSNLILADEINRASPKTQSALLEAMEERQVTLEGETRSLPEPFFVIATQNPSDQSGTHTLPESQLDRFMMRISLGYPSEAAEKQLLKGIDRRVLSTQLQAILNESTLGKIQELASKVQCSDSIIDYVYRLSALSRMKSNETHGLSPRANLALIQAAKAWAFIEGRDHVLPDDIQAVFPSVAEHRLSNGQAQQNNPLSQNILKSVDIF